MAPENSILPLDEAEILYGHIKVYQEEGLFDAIEAVPARARLGELVLNGEISQKEFKALGKEGYL